MELAKLHYQAQQVEQKPIVLMEALEGQTIMLSGVKTFAVYDQSQQANIRPYQKTYHPAWSILGSAVQIALPIYAQGYSMYKLADVVGKHAGGNWSNTGDYREGSDNIDVSGRVNSNDDISGRVSSNDDISGRVNSNDDYTHEPTVVEQPAPVVVVPPDPVIVEQPTPIIVEQPTPIVVVPPDPIVVEQPAPIIVTP